MPGQLSQWPDWPEFTFADAEKGDDLIQYKRAIVDKYGQEALTQSWLKTCKELESLTRKISKAGTSYIPEVEYEQLLTFSPEEKQKLMDVGCFKVKGVVARKQAEGWFKDLKQYVAKNRAAIKGMLWSARLIGWRMLMLGIGWPDETPFILNLYFVSDVAQHSRRCSDIDTPVPFADRITIPPECPEPQPNPQRMVARCRRIDKCSSLIRRWSQDPSTGGSILWPRPTHRRR